MHCFLEVCTSDLIKGQIVCLTQCQSESLEVSHTVCWWMEWCSLILVAFLSKNTMSHLNKAATTFGRGQLHGKLSRQNEMLQQDWTQTLSHWPLMAISLYYKGLCTKDGRGKKMTLKISESQQTSSWTEDFQDESFREVYACMFECT